MTIKQIAKLTGYDISTVSRALNDSDRVKLETRRRIQEVAKHNGYYRDDLARSLVSKKSETIGIIVPEFVNIFYAELIDGFESVFTPVGYTLLFGKSKFDPRRTEECIDAFLRKKVDGIIVCSSVLDVAQYEQFRASNVRFFFVDLPGGIEMANYVSVDNEHGVKSVIEYLHGLGHRKIAFIGDDVVTHTRLDAYRQSLRAFGLEPSEHYIASGSERFERAGYLRMSELLSLSDRPTAVFAATDNLAIGAMHAARERALRVPEDISLVGFDNIATASYITPELTTVEQPKHEMGRIAAQQLLHMLTSEQRRQPFQLRLRPSLIVRGTTCPPSNR